MANVGFLFAAFSLTWVVVFGYLMLMWRKQNRLEHGLRQLEERLHDRS